MPGREARKEARKLKLGSREAAGREAGTQEDKMILHTRVTNKKNVWEVSKKRVLHTRVKSRVKSCCENIAKHMVLKAQISLLLHTQDFLHT